MSCKFSLNRTQKLFGKGGNAWFRGEVVEILQDAFGEWLVVQYNHDQHVIVKEVQRFSKLLDVTEQYI